eukprot:gene214-11067_t
MWAGDKKIVFGDNVGALMAALRNHGSGRIKGRAYWLRRLALAMLEYCHRTRMGLTDSGWRVAPDIMAPRPNGAPEATWETGLAQAKGENPGGC